MYWFFITFIVQPFYNFLVVLVDYITNDLGLAIIIFTVLFRFIIFPLSKNQIKTQIKLKEIQEPLKLLKEKYKNDNSKMAQEMMRLYKENNIKPFSGLLVVFIQLPLLFGFYYIFTKTGLPQINIDLIYTFIKSPAFIDTNFFGIELTTKSFLLAGLGGITQYIQMKILLSNNLNNKPQKEKSSLEDIMENVQKQMSYTMPVLIGFISYSLGSIVALYFVTSNIFSIFQETYLKKTIRNKHKQDNKENQIIQSN